MSIRLRSLPRYPARISGISGISTYRDGPDLVVQSDYGALARIPSVDDEATSFFKVWNGDDNSYSIMTFEDVIAAIGSISGFMSIAVYDPNGHNADAFARGNHTGTQLISTVVGLQAALDALTAADATKLALAGGAMTGAIQDAVFAPSSAPTKKAHFDLSRVTAGQDRDIIVPDTSGLALSKWEVIPTTNPAAVASFDVPNLAAFQRLRISGHVFPSVASAINLVTSSNNGSSYDTGASDYNSQIVQGQGTSITGFSGNAAFIGISGGVAVTNTADDGIQFNIYLENFNKASRMKCQIDAFFIGAAGNYKCSVGAQRLQSTARNALRIIAASGTLTGTILVEGMRG